MKRRTRLLLDALEDRSVPATFYVNTLSDLVDPADRKLSLREAITAANARPGPDAIVLPAGVFCITLDAVSADPNATRDFDITDSVTITGAGRSLTIIDGQQVDRVVDVIGTPANRIKVGLGGLTVRNGKANGGGGILAADADLTLRDCAVLANQSSTEGGGISAFAGICSLKLVRSTVARNVAGGFGGGIIADATTLDRSEVRRNVAGLGGGGISAAAGTATLTNSAVCDNTAGGEGGGIRAATANLTKSTVSGNSAGAGGGIRAFDTATLSGCTVSGNSAGAGGGIFATTANLTRSIVSGNSAVVDGGGIYATTVAVTNGTVSGNSAGRDAGGIRAGTTTLIRCTVSGNFAGVLGGGIVASTVEVTNGTLSGNSAGSYGGGVVASAVAVTNSTVSGNTSSRADGGGIYAFGATLTNSTVSGNTAGQNGGGISATTATLTGCTVSGNRAATNGGGINATAATLTNCTVAENLANDGGGLFHESGGGAFNVTNTIVALNLVPPGGIRPDVAGLFISPGHNLIGTALVASGFTDGANGDLVGTSLNPIDPKLGPLANNGGPTKTHALLRGSPAIDRGSTDALATLTAAVDAKATTLQVSNTAPFLPGMALRLGGEVVTVVAVDTGNKTLTVRRGVSGTRSTHAVGTGLFLVRDQRGLARRKDGNGDGKSIIDIGAFER